MDFGHLMEITERPEIVFVEGRGSWLTDHAGKRYLDFVQGWAVNCLGHCPPAVVDALAAQSADPHHAQPGLLQRAGAEAGASARRATPISSASSSRNSGAEANEGAIKLARKWGRRFKGGAHEIITFDHGFHGRTLATMSASGKPGWDTMFAPQVPGFPKATLNDLASVEALIGERTAAVMLEPVQGESGVVPATVEFLRELRALTRRARLSPHRGRGADRGSDAPAACSPTSTSRGAPEEAPDIMTLGKGLGAGFPSPPSAPPRRCRSSSTASRAAPSTAARS